MKNWPIIRVIAALVCAANGYAADNNTAANTATSDAAAPQSSAGASQSSANATGNDATNSEQPSFTGFIDLGYRWQTTVGGNLNMYRSVVNLGSGPKLLGTEFTILNPSGILFDRIDARAYNWGDDPYETLHVTATKKTIYNFDFDYRNIAYYNNIPSYANPILASGGAYFNSESAFDMRKKLYSFELDLFPTSWIVPYVAYERPSDNGQGITQFVAARTEFPVTNFIRDSMNNYRAGIRFNKRLFHGTIEQGGTTFKDDQQLLNLSGPNYPGNCAEASVTSCLLNTAQGQPITLNTLTQTYGIRNHSVYTRANITGNVTDWFDFFGQYLYSKPESDINFTSFATGNFNNFPGFYSGLQALITGTANLPHNSASVGAELFPRRRFRMTVNWLTDRQQTTGLSSALQTIIAATGSTPSTSAYSTLLRDNYSQFEIDASFDITPQLTFRAGYRYVLGDTGFYFLPVEGLFPTGSGQLRQNIGIGGLTYHPSTKFRVNATIEASPGQTTYFRNGLYNYQRASLQARYQVSSSLSAGVDYGIVNNQNPTPGINYDFRGQQASASLYWAPKEAKRFSVLAEYTRSTDRSNIFYLNPPNSASVESIYRDDAHLVTGLIDLALGTYAGLTPHLSFGGSFVRSSGSLPTQYYQPQGRLTLPLTKHVSWISSWTYYGYNENFFVFQGFRDHLITTGLRLSR